ncbi:MAG: acetate--CoA ligase family protein [Syntrophales bacterium]
MDVIKQAHKEGRKILTEYEAKLILGSRGIPVVKERLAGSKRACRAAAVEIGFPVVMKGCAPGISHKTELGLVLLDIRNKREAEEAFEKIAAKMPGGKPVVLIQEMIKGSRELIVGLTRDAQFGPTVMFGLGGAFTEVLSNVAFRLAPFDRREAFDMIGQINARKILDDIRGMGALDTGLLADILVSVGNIAADYPDIKEIDINPFVISAGVPVAVDALVVLK